MYILNKDRPTGEFEEWNSGFKAYNEYLASCKNRLPPSAFEFATADWHYDFRDSRAPHDAWVESVYISEGISIASREQRALNIEVKLLGAYNDGTILLNYFGVSEYNIGSQAIHHGDLFYDEIRLNDDGKVVHEIEFVRFNEITHWVLVCEDVSYRWLPFLEGSGSLTL